MKKIELYVCDVCGLQYDKEEECRRCEEHHVRTSKIIREVFSCFDPYPSVITVEMTDGRTATYKR